MDRSPTDPLPSWAASRVNPDDLARLGALSRATGWKVDLGLTLGHPDLGRWRRRRPLPGASIGTGLATVQIGNEPDLLGNLRAGYDRAADYRSDAAAYRAARRRRTRCRGIRSGHRASRRSASYAAGEGTALATLDQHFYPLSRCGGVKPTIDELLSAVHPQHRSAPRRSRGRGRPFPRAARPTRRDQLGVVWRSGRREQHTGVCPLDG